MVYPVIAVFGRWRLEDQEFKVILNCIVSLRPAWVTWYPITNKQRYGTADVVDGICVMHRIRSLLQWSLSAFSDFFTKFSGRIQCCTSRDLQPKADTASAPATGANQRQAELTLG